jgi:hypothetical protein
MVEMDKDMTKVMAKNFEVDLNNDKKRKHLASFSL